METYKVERIYFSDDYGPDLIETGLSLDEAQEWCQNPEGSSRTCKATTNIERTNECGSWFECYTTE